MISKEEFENIKPGDVIECCVSSSGEPINCKSIVFNTDIFTIYGVAEQVKIILVLIRGITTMIVWKQL